MQRHLQLELKRDLRCRLPVPSVYVPNIHIGWHWDPDALARWHTVIPTCRLVSKAGRPAQKVLLEYRTALENAVESQVVWFLL
jgi:hypothetical protein